MKNKRKICFALALTASVCISVSIPAYASTDYINHYDFFGEGPENSCYVIDFMDYDGNLLDSRICAYGEKLTDVKNPEPREDEEYIYQFVAWEPQLCETVTECAAYIATYQKIRKDKLDDPDPTFEPIIQEQSVPTKKAASDGFDSEEITQVSSTSHDVTRFTLETPVPKTDESDNVSVSADVMPETEDTKKATPKPEPTKKSAQDIIEDANAPLPDAASSPNTEASLQTQTTTVESASSADSADSMENILSEISADTPAPAQKKPADSPSTEKSSQPYKTMPHKNTTAVSENAQIPTYQSSVSEPSLSETKLFSKIAFPVPLLFIGMAACRSFSRMTSGRKHS